MKAKRARKRGARGSISVSSTVTKGGEKSESETVSKEMTREVPDNPAYVGVSGGMTKNLGDFNSAKINVSVTLPCENTQDALQATYEEASELVDGWLDSEYKKAVEE